ncbi:MAG: hypothetical protein MJ087_00265 [Lachnospiraceae bacterium]|nr:hypothetical protein [Lachnospiraceae bacterium]
MTDEIKTTVETTEEKEVLQDSKGNTYETRVDWAEAAYQELADYIEEQGIYIRY